MSVSFILFLFIYGCFNVNENILICFKQSVSELTLSVYNFVFHIDNILQNQVFIIFICNLNAPKVLMSSYIKLDLKVYHLI